MIPTTVIYQGVKRRADRTSLGYLIEHSDGTSTTVVFGPHIREVSDNPASIPSSPHVRKGQMI